MSGMTERETLKTITVMLSIAGTTGLLVTMFLAKVMPMI